MNLSIEFRDDVLWVMVRGMVTLAEAIRVYTEACDAAVDRGVGRILVDASAAEGDLSYMERYELGETMADYYVSKSLGFKVAMVGKAPLVDEFSALVASNHGVTAETFAGTTDAVEWLNRFGRSEVRRSKADPLGAVDEAYRLLQKAHGGYKEALAIIADIASSPDGEITLRQHSREYADAVTRYSEAVAAWLAYVETNREQAVKLLKPQ